MNALSTVVDGEVKVSRWDGRRLVSKRKMRSRSVATHWSDHGKMKLRSVPGQARGSGRDPTTELQLM